MQDIIAPVHQVKFAVEEILRDQSSLWTLPFEGMDKSGEEICRVFTERGQCPRGKLCPFRHTLGEKSVVCKHWLRGLCKKGDDCEFLHLYDMEKMPECHFYTNFGECNNEDCKFLHIDPDSKKKDCLWFARGFCKHGPTCRSRHAKKVMCPQYLCGLCLAGPKCKLTHPPWDMAPDAVPAAASAIICRRCHTPGHKAPQCPNFPPRTTEGPTIVCHTCQMPGHKTPQCPLNEGQPIMATCYKCNERGHKSYQCTKVLNA